MVLYEDESAQVQSIVQRLVEQSNAQVAFLIDKNGQLIGSAGHTEQIDTTSLASLTAGNVAATGGIAQLLRESEFATQFHEGKRTNIHIQLVGSRVILVVIFDTKTSLGLVRLRVKKATEELVTVFNGVLNRAANPRRGSPFAEISDEDIDHLFGE